MQFCIEDRDIALPAALHDLGRDIFIGGLGIECQKHLCITEAFKHRSEARGIFRRGLEHDNSAFKRGHGPSF